jgi:hypothetical protein
MNFLLDCALGKVNDEMSLYDYSNGQLANKLPDIGFMVLKLTRMGLNNEIADFAKALHGEKTTFFKAKVFHNFEVFLETLRKNLLKDQYLTSEINLKHQEDDTIVVDNIVKFQCNGTSRKS